MIRLGREIKNPPLAMQIAKDRRWEECWILDAHVGAGSEQIADYLAGEHYKELAVEMVWEGQFILGINYAKHLLTSAQEFLETVIENGKNSSDFESLVAELDKTLAGQRFLLEGEPELIRIGVVNHWFSVGPIEVWRKGQAKTMSPTLLEQILNNKPEVETTKLNYQGLSFIFNLESKAPGTCHWMKAPCSRKLGEVWELDREKICKYLHEWAGFGA